MSEQTAPQLPAEIQQQVNILNIRIANANFANADLLREMEATFKQLLAKISELEQENAELKAKPKEKPKKPENSVNSSIPFLFKKGKLSSAKCYFTLTNSFTVWI